METTDLLMVFHVFAGVLSLVSGMMIFVMAKGTRFHVRVGQLYFLAMLLVFLTSVWVSIYKGNWFLLLVGIFSFYLVQSGIELNKFRKQRIVSFWNKLRVIIAGIAFLTMIVLSILVFQSKMVLSIILLVFGLIGLSLVRMEFIYFILNRPAEDPRVYFREHIGRMTGSYIAAVTAFLVNNVHGMHPLLIWLGPTLIGFAVIRYFDRSYR